MSYKHIQIPEHIKRDEVPLLAWRLMEYYGGKLSNYPSWFGYYWGSLPRQEVRQEKCRHPALNSLEWRYFIQKKRTSIYPEYYIWVIEHLDGKWYVDTGHTNRLYFERKDEAMAFKLRWL